MVGAAAGQSAPGECKAREEEKGQTRPRAVFVAASRARLAFHVYPRCCERAVIFEQEVSVQIIEVLSESPRVTLAIDTNRDDQVFVPIAAWRAGRIKGPGEMVVMIAPIHSLLVRALTKGSRDQ